MLKTAAGSGGGTARNDRTHEVLPPKVWSTNLHVYTVGPVALALASALPLEPFV